MLPQNLTVLKRKYIEDSLFINKRISLNQDSSHHISTVLRMKRFALLRVFNEHSGEFLAQIEAYNKKICQLKILSLLKSPNEKDQFNIDLALSIIKKDKLLNAIFATTQLGIKTLIPLYTNRSQCKSLNIKSLQKNIIKATEQSERISITKIISPSLMEVVLNNKYQKIIFLNEKEGQNNLLSNFNFDKKDSVLVLIGPEGGFDDSERQKISSKKNIISASISENILNADIAAISAISYITLNMSRI